MTWLCLLVCFAFLIADRWLILHQFGFRYVDDDQSIMWSAATEMASGHFHEPCFYGQRYNTMLEGLLAVPLLRSGMRADMAVPLVTSALTLFPFALLALLLVRERAHALAAFVLVFPVTLSPEFGMVTSMPRGFVTGIFLSSFAVLPLFSRRGVFLFFAPFFAILALFANPNAALLLLPTVLLIAWTFRKDRRFYVLGAAGALPAALLYYWGRRFYDERPNYIVHPDWDPSFDVAYIRWADLRFLDDVSPILWGKGLFVPLIVLALIAWLGWKKQWSAAICLLAGLLLLVVSFGLHKVHDGVANVFFPWARMFLAIPFLLMLFLSRSKVRGPGWAMWSMPVLAACFFGYKCFVQNEAVERQVDPRMDTKVEMTKVADLERHCLRIQQVAQAERADLLVVSWGKYKHLINYGCPCLLKNFPRTIEPSLDRRTWLLKDVAPKVIPKVLLTGMGEEHFAGLRRSAPRVELVGKDPLLYLVKNDTMPLATLLDVLGLGLRPY